MTSHPDIPRSPRIGNGSRPLVLVLLGVAVCAALVFSAERAPSDPHSMHMMKGSASAPMTDESMARWVRDWYAAHPARGQSASASAADTFSVVNFAFDTDGSVATQVDTAKIQVGQTILWVLSAGVHTTTNGDGSVDPAAGTLWDQPLTTPGAEFSFTFADAGTYPFFCRPHEGFVMKGVVVVSTATSVPAPTHGGARLAFVADPAPNPTGAGMRFQFSLARAGRVRAQLFDLSGQLVARILDRDLEPGIHAGGWDGRTLSSSSAAPGMYYLSLNADGMRLTRQVTVVR